MESNHKKLLSEREQQELIKVLKTRFDKNMDRHDSIEWDDVLKRLILNPHKLWSLNEMEISGGEPDVIGQGGIGGEISFYDCAAETPKGRRSVCYDREGWESRKDNKPENTAIDMAAEMGIDILNEEQYLELQKYGAFDTKTSSWIKTPEAIRKLGGAVFADYRYGQVFVYHNGAGSYYSARAFRGILII
jgi:hypothetical protein